MSDFRLRVFSCVAKNLSFTKASQELFISQPAITKHIQELETMYQTRLFERMGNKISLTDAGRLLLEHCEKILEEYGRLEYEMNLLRNEHIGKLRLGASTTIAQYVLPPLLARFIEKFPQVSLSLYNPQIQISAESETKRSIFRKRDKTKRSKKESAQHSKGRNKSFVMTSVSAL